MRRSLFFLLPILIANPDIAAADWIEGGVPVIVAPGQQGYPKMVSDGHGGVIISWDSDYNMVGGRYDKRDLYAQRLDENGNALWVSTGLPICKCVGYQTNLFIESDGAGGAIVAWGDSDGGSENRLFAARVTGNGEILWKTQVAQGVGTPKRDSRMISDGAGGAVFAWSKYSGSYAFVQRVDANGALMWGSSGTRIQGGGTWGQENPKLAMDATSNTYVVWTDFRRSYEEEYPYRIVRIPDIYTQRMSFSGEQQWPTHGVLAGNDAFTGDRPWGTMIAGQSDGAVIAFRQGTGLFARRMSSDGNVAWGDVPVSSGAGLMDADLIVLADGHDGTLVTWRDGRNGNSDAYAQRLAADGTAMWSPDGAPLYGGDGDQNIYEAVADETGGLIAVIGQYFCCGPLRLQRLDGDAQMPWGATGVSLSDQVGYYAPGILVDDENVFCAWMDFRNGYADIFAQRFNLADGSWGTPVSVAITSFSARVTGGGVRINASFRSDLGVERINVYRGNGTTGSMPRLTEAAPPARDFEYVDRTINAGATYRYQIGVVDADGEFFSPIETVTVPKMVSALHQNSPNPFNPVTTIRYTLAARERVQLVVYRADGALVRVLLDATREAGSHDVEWDGTDNRGAGVASGVYFYRLTAGKFSESRSMVLLK